MAVVSVLLGLIVSTRLEGLRWFPAVNDEHGGIESQLHTVTPAGRPTQGAGKRVSPAGQRTWR